MSNGGMPAFNLGLQQVYLGGNPGLQQGIGQGMPGVNQHNFRFLPDLGEAENGQEFANLRHRTERGFFI